MAIYPPSDCHLKALQLGCRRGLPEVELLLMAYWQFLANPSTDELNLTEDCQLFEQLLMETDQQLFEWLLSPQQAPSHYSGLVERIRSHYLKK